MILLKHRIQLVLKRMKRIQMKVTLFLHQLKKDNKGQNKNSPEAQAQVQDASAINSDAQENSGEKLLKLHSNQLLSNNLSLKWLNKTNNHLNLKRLNKMNNRLSLKWLNKTSNLTMKTKLHKIKN